MCDISTAQGPRAPQMLKTAPPRARRGGGGTWGGGCGGGAGGGRQGGAVFRSLTLRMYRTVPNIAIITPPAPGSGDPAGAARARSPGRAPLAVAGAAGAGGGCLHGATCLKVCRVTPFFRKCEKWRRRGPPRVGLRPETAPGGGGFPPHPVSPGSAWYRDRKISQNRHFPCTTRLAWTYSHTRTCQPNKEI